jgi:4-hydroxybenzoate polyprenyltransferase
MISRPSRYLLSVMEVRWRFQVERRRQLLVDSVRRAQAFSVVQGAVAAAKSVFAMAVLGVTTPLAPVVLGLVAFAVYTANDIADIEEDAVNCPDHSSVVADHTWLVGTVALGVLGLAGALAWWGGGPVALAAALVPLVAALLYSLPVAPGGRRLKDVFVVNTALVSLAWAATLTAVPLALAGRGVGPVALAVCLFFLLRTFVSVETFNVRDIAGDAKAGVETLPVVLGRGRTTRVLALFEGCTLATLVALLTVPHATLPALFALPVMGTSLALTSLLTGTSEPGVVCLARDAEYLLLGAVGLLFV